MTFPSHVMALSSLTYTHSNSACYTQYNVPYFHLLCTLPWAPLITHSFNFSPLTYILQPRMIANLSLFILPTMIIIKMILLMVPSPWIPTLIMQTIAHIITLIIQSQQHDTAIVLPKTLRPRQSTAALGSSQAPAVRHVHISSLLQLTQQTPPLTQAEQGISWTRSQLLTAH